MNIVVLFIILSIVNVLFSTVRTITTVKSGKVVASLISGGYFAFYNIMLIYSVADFELWQKCLITFVCNVLGVFIIKLIEEKMRKDKLWEIRTTIRNDVGVYELQTELENEDVSYCVIDTHDNDYVILNIYSPTQKDSAKIKNILSKYNAKYFVSESKIL